MRAKWLDQKKLKPQMLMDKMRAISSAHEGRVAFNAFEKFELDAVLLNIIEFDPKYSFSTRSRFYQQAIQQCAERQLFTAQALIDEVNDQIVRYGRTPEQEYDYIFSLSLYREFPFERLEVNGSKITFMKSGLQRKYRTRDLHKWKSKFSPMPDDYLPVRVRCLARDVVDGFEKALYDIDFLRGLLCLLTNSDMQYSIGTPFRGPLNKVILGGMHSAHYPDGQLVNERLFWYERDEPSRAALVVLPKNAALFKKNLRWLLGRTQGHPDSSMLKDAIVRYARAFDSLDRNVTIQKGWAAIESIVSPRQNNADLIVKRCSFMYVDPDYQAQILEHLRFYRNRNVHNGYEIEDLDGHCYHLQGFFREAVLFYLKNKDFFEDIHEANSFLDLPSDIGKLIRRKVLTAKALKFLGE